MLIVKRKRLRKIKESKRWMIAGSDGRTDDEILIDLLTRKKFTKEAIAKKMGRSVSSIYQRIIVLSLHKNTMTKNRFIENIYPEIDLITECVTILHGRVMEKFGMYFLDGFPVHSDFIVRAANAERARYGLVPIGRKPEWLPA